VKGRILRPLRRLKLVRVTEAGLALTLKGLDFVNMILQDGCVTKVASTTG
jgi:hypothetical protein